VLVADEEKEGERERFVTELEERTDIKRQKY